MQVPKQAKYYAVFFETICESIEEILSKAPDVLAAHRTRSNEWHTQGKLFMAGAFNNDSPGPIGTMGICPTREIAEEFAKGDPFFLKGMVSKWYIREWNNLLV